LYLSRASSTIKEHIKGAAAMRRYLAIAVGFFSAVLGQNSWAAAGAACFKMAPKKTLDYRYCPPVPISVQFIDCTTKQNLEKVEGTANFDCRTRPRRLVYPYKGAVLIGEVEPAPGGSSAWMNYKVTNNYVFGSLPPSAVPTPTPQPAAADAGIGATIPTPHLAKPETETVPPAQKMVSDHHGVNMSDVKLSGMVDAYYAYNMLQPPPTLSAPASGSGIGSAGTVTSPPVPQNTGHFYDLYHDQFSLGLAKISLSHEADPVGFKIDLGFGPSAEFAAGPQTDTTNRHLLQAYLSYKTPFGLVIDAGKFATHMGYEVFEAADNANYSRSFLFTYAVPLWHQGLRMTYDFNHMVTLSAHAVNGWNNMYENNRGKSLGGQIVVRPIEEVALTLNYMAGPEVSGTLPAPTYASRESWDYILSTKPVPFLKLAGEYVTTAETMADTSRRILSGWAAYATWDILDDLSLSPRFEWMDDSNIATFGTGYNNSGVGQKLHETTVTLEYRATENFKLRAEYRTDVSDNQPFTDYSSNTPTPTGIQTIGLLSGIVSF